MVKVRAVFEKRGRAKYISHLDLNRCMQRAFRRSGLPVWYTEGFNPHIYITFALPLSLGYESSVEIMDFNMTEEVSAEETAEKLNKAMPEGLKIVKVYSPETKHTAIKSAEYRIRFGGDCEKLRSEFERFMSQDEINTVKRTKRGGEKLIDLKPDTGIKELTCRSGVLEVVLRLPAGNEKNLNPSLITDMFTGFCNTPAELLSVERTGIFSENNELFL
ncbi:MAG: TIGR03936 family radical SAM-associated protein [Porcipelethomonas sp.]